MTDKGSMCISSVYSNQIKVASPDNPKNSENTTRFKTNALYRASNSHNTQAAACAQIGQLKPYFSDCQLLRPRFNY